MALGLTRHQVDGMVKAGKWIRLSPSTFLIDADPDLPVPRRARIRAALLSLGRDAVAVLGTAAELHGIAGLSRTDEIHISLPVEEARRARLIDPAVTLHQLVITGSAVSTVDGIPVTTPLRTIADVILRVDRYSAVSVLDSAINKRIVALDDLATIPALIRGRRGAVAARTFLSEVDGRAQSPLETRTRLRCVDGRVPPDELQVSIRDADGYLLGIGDLGWLGARIIGEADGVEPHGTPEAIFADRRRQNRIANAGWLVLRFTWADTCRADYIPYVVRSALVRRQREGFSPDRGTRPW